MHNNVNANNAHHAFAHSGREMHNAHMNNLTKYRKLRGLSQADLAEITGLNQSTIQRAETEHASAKLSTYRACAKALDISLGKIFADARDDLENELLSALHSWRDGEVAEASDILAQIKGQRRTSG